MEIAQVCSSFLAHYEALATASIKHGIYNHSWHVYLAWQVAVLAQYLTIMHLSTLKEKFWCSWIVCWNVMNIDVSFSGKNHQIIDK